MFTIDNVSRKRQRIRQSAALTGKPHDGGKSFGDKAAGFVISAKIHAGVGIGQLYFRV